MSMLCISSIRFYIIIDKTPCNKSIFILKSYKIQFKFKNLLDEATFLSAILIIFIVNSKTY